MHKGLTKDLRISRFLSVIYAHSHNPHKIHKALSQSPNSGKEENMKRFLKYAGVTFLGILMIFLLVLLLIFMPKIKSVLELRDRAKLIVDSGSSADFSKTRTSVVYDCNNEIIMTYSGEKDLYYVRGSEIPEDLKNAFIIMEDRQFYNHAGVDIKAVIRAVVANYNANDIVQGASTITQQLARNIYLNQDVNWERKILEAFMALEIEKKYSKDDILEFYLNNIYFGNGYYGVEAAARGYLNKSVSKLTTGECIFLASIPNNPSKYDPVNKEENTVNRSRLILKQMYDAGMINELNYLKLSGDEENPFVPDFMADAEITAMNKTTADTYIYTYVTYCAVRYLMRENGFVFKNDFNSEEELDYYDESYDNWYTYYQQALYTGGYYIYTSLDLNAQKLLQDTVDDIIAQNDAEYAGYRNGEISEITGNPLQAAAVTMDNETGLVVAIVGGRNEKTNGYGFNRAYQSFRQPGSSIKPLNVYAPYLCLGHSTQEIVNDVYDPNGPKNAGGAYAGEMTLRQAVAKSKNTIAWQIYRYITPQKGCDYLLRMGFKKVYPDKNYMAGALGGFTYGVSAEEMTAGYHTIANNGIYNPPTCIRGIYKNETDEVKAQQPEVYVYSENAALNMTSMLESVIEEGTGQKAKLTAHEAAGKTGTTNGNKDMWFVGFTKYYTTGVWVGNDKPSESELPNGNLAVTIWHDYMEKLHIGLTPQSFDIGDYVSPEKNESLTDLADLPVEIGDIPLETLWDNDIDAVFLEMWGEFDADGLFGDRPAENTAGTDTDATVTGGDTNAAVTGGDTNAAVTGGDTNAAVTGGDTNADVTGGDTDATVTGGDSNAAITGGDTDATITGGDSNAAVTGGDTDAVITGIDTDVGVDKSMLDNLP